jgi:guanine deaminase
VRPVITPRFVPTCSPALLHGLGAIARRTGVLVQSHISENKGEVRVILVVLRVS